MSNWRDDASCRHLDPEDINVFFPWTAEVGDKPSQSDIKYATGKYCDGCPVRDACLDFAAKTGSQGIWGGVYISYRKAIRLQNMKTTPSREDIKNLLKYEESSDEQ